MGKKDVGFLQTSRKRNKLPTQRGLAVAKTAIVVIVDGNTEKKYFEKINELGIFPNLRFKPIQGDDCSYENIFKENHDISYKFLVLDIDHCIESNTKRSIRIKTILSKKETKDIAYFNNYSFETFLLSHLVAFGCPITEKKQYDAHMKNHFCVSGWSKYKNERNTSLVIAKITEESFKNMMVNIARIYKENCFENPNSNMHLMFEKLEKIK
ncbi:MAG: RloB family protein [Firmicutes bacterium]|nr:RloB family protein [Bacillota bacterium]